jgi:hypothetical protein
MNNSSTSSRQASCSEIGMPVQFSPKLSGLVVTAPPRRSTEYRATVKTSARKLIVRWTSVSVLLGKAVDSIMTTPIGKGDGLVPCSYPTWDSKQKSGQRQEYNIVGMLRRFLAVSTHQECENNIHRMQRSTHSGEGGQRELCRSTASLGGCWKMVRGIFL